MSEDLLVDGYDYNPHTCMVEVPYNDYWDMKDRIINLKKENEYLQNQLQQKENIIKEIREYIKTQIPIVKAEMGIPNINTSASELLNYEKILEILDKEVN